MLSILIPVYNFDIRPLVQALHEQCIAHKIDFEILCFDDVSDKKFKVWNKSITHLEKVIYQELSQNLGRAKIRNFLGKQAQYPYLLFMDCDSKVTDNQYIKNYLVNLAPTTLLYGGRIYATTSPIEKNLNLHYYYGKNREEILTEERKIKSYHSFMTNNFLIPKSIFLDILFEEGIQGYGHEDTLFGMALQQRNIPILHLNNPLEHLGLENTATFLKKQETAIRNLYLLYQKNPLLETKLLDTFVTCKKWGMDGIILFFLNLLHPLILSQLHKKQPNLFYLDLFKLHYLLKIDKNGIDNLSS